MTKQPKIRETELFKRASILLLDKNKEQMEELKEKVSLISNIEVDNSALIRGMLEYFYDHPKKLEELAPYVRKSKGFHILNELHEMMENNRSIEDIEKRLGINIDIIKQAKVNKEDDSQ